MNNNLSDNNWHTVKDQKYDIALLPWGATEAHNYHLPYGTDTILAEDTASRAALLAKDEGVNCVVLPSIAYGVNSGQMDVKLCMNIHPSTQYKILEDIIEVLLRHEIYKLVIINAHGGNNFQPIIRELSVKHPEIMLFNVNWWMAENPGLYFDEPGDHAGELETSCIQAIRPELALPLEFAGDGREHKMKLSALNQKWAWTPRKWIYTTDDTGVGDPKMSNSMKGTMFLVKCIENIAKFLTELKDIKSEEELYEK